DTLEVGKPVASVESVKAAAESYAPVIGKVVAVNEELPGNPEILNSDPYGAGWMIQLEGADGNGAMLSFGSDWPGTSAALYHMHPKYLIYAAVTRQTLTGEPEGGWFPEQRIGVEEALRAYTINNALAAFEADTRGSLEAGKLADITVFDRDMRAIPPVDILKTEVTHTIVGGKIVFSKN
ncbi:MAG: amidohydrolase family protein, partial [Candidatus Aminicenantes bacterium]